MLELIIDHPVWKAFPANPDSLEDTVASQLMHHQVGIQNSGLLVIVRHDASGKEQAQDRFQPHSLLVVLKEITSNLT